MQNCVSSFTKDRNLSIQPAVIVSEVGDFYFNCHSEEWFRIEENKKYLRFQNNTSYIYIKKEGGGLFRLSKIK